MIDALLDWAQPSGRGRLLDLACGTGQICFALAERSGEVWAIDQESDVIDLLREKAGQEVRVMFTLSSHEPRTSYRHQVGLSW
jgi:ubiquinone/menaquinone biosynthesis C-methylase UbiE